MVPAVIPSLEAAAVRPGSVGTCARMVGCVPLSQKISVFSFISNHDVISESQNGFRVQAVLRASMGSSATRSVIVPIMDAATGPMEPVCVILDSTDASATSVSPSVLIIPDSYITRLFSKIFWVDLRDIHIFFFKLWLLFWCEILLPCLLLPLVFSLQRVLSGPSARAALMSVGVCRRIRWSVTADTAHVSVNLDTRATPVRKVRAVSQSFVHHKTLLNIYWRLCYTRI